MTRAPIQLQDLATSAPDARLRRALDQAPKWITSADLVALIRSEAVREGYAPIAIPIDGGWPDQEDWMAGGFRLREATSEHQQVVEPQAWLPSWADNGIPPDQAAASREVRQPREQAPGDPFLTAASGGHPHYRTVGQRDAVRAALAAQPGDSVLAVLPTGSGKTLAATAPAYLARPSVTVFIVPTVSLALDLERRIRSDYGLNTPIAYHGGLAVEQKQLLRERLRSLEQWIVVTSPEAATTSLAPTLEALASEGRLRYLVIDEAHIVASWGGAFRPAFQALAGLRRQLQSAARTVRKDFTTLLLTGTLDNHCLGLLEHFFSDGDLTVVAAQATRPEPAYWAIEVPDKATKRAHLVDALRHLPRPVLVYTSLVESELGVNATAIERWLREAGFGRVRRVTGVATTEERQSVISAIRCEGDPNDDCDVVVASSAFGLGVDIDDVRAVVHVCVPESLDRFYQEVGRAGRDGRASVSLLISSPEDHDIAAGLAAPGNIGLEKAWARWKAMRAGATLSGDLLTVSLTAARSGIAAPASPANRNWNLHTLTLMELAGMIRLLWNPPAEPPELSSDEELADYFGQHFRLVNIEVMHGDLDSEEAFARRLSAIRVDSRAAAAASLMRLKDLLQDQRQCFNNVFATAYTLRQSNGDISYPVHRCGGCPECRANHRRWRVGQPVEPYIRSPQVVVPSRLLALFEGRRCCSVTYSGPLDAETEAFETLLQRLVEAGIQLLVAPGTLTRVVTDAVGSNQTRWVAVDSLETWRKRLHQVAMSTVVLLPPDQPNEVVADVIERCNADSAIVVIHNDGQLGPASTKLLLRETISRSVDLTSALRRI
jgi:ATP-dependent DNA helicase RecQ